MAELSLRVDLASGARIGPGKIALLEAIAAAGSISAGARTTGMSYRRAWALVEEMNHIFGRRVIETRAGGREGGGARLTDTGAAVVARFRAIERAAQAAAANHLATLAAMAET